MKLLKSQKNELYDWIVAFGLSPSQFNFKESKNGIGFGVLNQMQFEESEYHFIFDRVSADGRIMLSFCPGIDRYIESHLVIDWFMQKEMFRRWLNALNKEINEPDKWELLEKEMNQFNITFDDSTDKFSASEYEDLKQRMNQLKEGIKANDLLSEHFEILNAKIVHLTESALTMNKFDWKSQFVGTVINLSMYLAFSEEARTAFLGLIKIALSPIILIP